MREVSIEAGLALTKFYLGAMSRSHNFQSHVAAQFEIYTIRGIDII
jgi:hypothetical protein